MALHVVNPNAPGQVIIRKVGLFLGDIIRGAALVFGAWGFIAVFILAFAR